MALNNNITGRLFVIRPIEFYTMLLEPVGLHPVASFRDVDCLGRQGIEWVSAVYR